MNASCGIQLAKWDETLRDGGSVADFERSISRMNPSTMPTFVGSRYIPRRKKVNSPSAFAY